MGEGADVLPNTQCPLQHDHCPWVVSGPLWELLREHPDFILQLQSASLVQQVLSGQVVPYTDVEPSGQALRKQYEFLRGWCYTQCKKDYSEQKWTTINLEKEEKFFALLKMLHWVATSLRKPWSWSD